MWVNCCENRLEVTNVQRYASTYGNAPVTTKAWRKAFRMALAEILVSEKKGSSIRKGSLVLRVTLL